MMVPWRSLNILHNVTAQCKKEADQKLHRLASKEARKVTSRDFSAYGRPLKIMTPFKYLGRVLSAAFDEWLVMVRNIVKSQTVWQRMLRILSREGLILQV